MAVAEAAGRSGQEITQSYISAILRGRDKNPSLAKLEAIASGLDVPIAELFRTSDSPASLPDQEETREILKRLKIVFSKNQLSEKILKAAIEAAYQEISKK
jgi:transcriptional regulator with XRE-family HTH domain